MIVRIRQFCCALTTFVRLVSVFFLVFHILLAIAATIWYSLRHLQWTKEKETAENGVVPTGEVDDRTFDTFLIGSENEEENEPEENNPNLDLIIVVILGVFAFLGVLVNLLLLFAIPLGRRTLFLPWLVFHLITVVGCFAGGIYLAVWFTILQDPPQPWMAIFAVFPLVGGIFLIFLWIFVDQLYIQMGVKKKTEMAIPHHHASLSSIPTAMQPGSVGAVRRKNLMVIDHSSYANSYASLPRPGKVLGVGEVERRQYQNGATPRSKRSRPVVRTKSMSSQIRTANPNRRHDPFDPIYRHQRARSLEHILDGSSSSDQRAHHVGLRPPSGPNYWVANGATLAQHRPSNTRAKRAPSVENMLDESSLETNSTSIPSYCTVDRRKQPRFARGRPQLISSDDSSDTQPPPRVPVIPPHKRVYKVNSFQQRPQGVANAPVAPSGVQMLLGDEPMMIQYDDEIVGTTRFNVEESSNSNSMVDLDLNMLPLDAKTLPQEAIRSSHHHPRNNRPGPRRRSGYNTDTIRSNHSAKSVTIANQVTEFHYSEDDRGSTINRLTKGTSDWLPEPVYPLPPPPPPPPVLQDEFRGRQPTPPPPTPPPPALPQEEEIHPKSWLSRLSPLKSRKDLKSDPENIVDLYYSVSDVRL